MTDRYHVANSQGTFQAGSNEQVLSNKLGIATQEEINELELMLLEQLYVEVLLNDLPNRRLSVDDLKRWHRRWLGNVYDWAGQERSVNIGKGGFLFAPAGQIPRLLTQFEQNCLRRWTPCHNLGVEELVEAVAVTHVELILVHPFREGNGRLSRLLADVMMVQAGKEPLDYSSWETHKDAYIGAIHRGMAADYAPMKHWVLQAMGIA